MQAAITFSVPPTFVAWNSLLLPQAEERAPRRFDQVAVDGIPAAGVEFEWSRFAAYPTGDVCDVSAVLRTESGQSDPRVYTVVDAIGQCEHRAVGLRVESEAERKKPYWQDNDATDAQKYGTNHDGENETLLRGR